MSVFGEWSPASETARSDVPTVSVIMIFHNAEATIAEAIDSVIAQSRSDWELILVDDGSTDGGAEIAAGYVRSQPGRIRCVRHESGGNLGTGASRSLGLSLVRGRYVAFLDADDLFHPERLERHLLALEADPTLAMVQGLLVYWHSWDSVGHDVDEEPVFDDPATVIRPPGMLVLMLRTAGARVPGVCSVTLRTDAVRAVGGFESGFRDVYEDQVLWAKLYLYGDVLSLHDRLAWYRQHLASVTHRTRRSGEYTPGRPHPARERLFRWLEMYLQSQPQSWPELHEIVRNELREHSGAEVAGMPLSARLRALSSIVLPPSLHERLLAMWGRRKSRRVSRLVRETAARVQRDFGRPLRDAAASGVCGDDRCGDRKGPSAVGNAGVGQ